MKNQRSCNLTLEVITNKENNDMMKLNLELYRKMYLIRRAEEKIIEHYSENEMKTPMHMSMGGEAISAGICHALKKEDQVFGTYRSHALYLAKTQNIYNFFAEMYGKETALLKGKGGSMHLCDPDNGFLGTSAIVASIIPVAIGAAFANKRMNNKKIVAVFFGDGATDEGVFWESVNVACLMKLPVIFICEDNEIAVHTPAAKRQGYNDITEILSKFNCYVFKESSTDVEIIYHLANKAIKLINENRIPCILHLKYYRYLEHVGVNKDFDAGYRAQEEFEKWYEKDPIKIQRSKIKDIGYKEKDILRLEQDIDECVTQCIYEVKKAPFAGILELHKGVL